MVLLMMSASALWGQDQSSKGQAGSGVAELKSSLASNQAKLRTYQWNPGDRGEHQGEDTERREVPMSLRT